MYEVWMDATARPALLPSNATKKRGKKGKLGSTGPAAIGVIIKEDGKVIKKISKYIGIYDNNVAEYKALLEALAFMIDLDAQEVKVYTDSNLLDKQMKYQYKCYSPAVAEVYREARRLSKLIPAFSTQWIPREQNKKADRLAAEVFKHWDGSLLTETP